MKVFTNHTDWVVAANLRDAQRVVEDHHGVRFAQEGWSLDEWSQVPDDNPITVRNIEGRDTEDDKLTKTAGEWAKSHGRGFLCSTEY